MKASLDFSLVSASKKIKRELAGRLMAPADCAVPDFSSLRVWFYGADLTFRFQSKSLCQEVRGQIPSSWLQSEQSLSPDNEAGESVRVDWFDVNHFIPNSLEVWDDDPDPSLVAEDRGARRVVFQRDFLGIIRSGKHADPQRIT